MSDFSPLMDHPLGFFPGYKMLFFVSLADSYLGSVPGRYTARLLIVLAASPGGTIQQENRVSFG